LKSFKIAKKLLKHYIAAEPLQPLSYYLLGEIFEREKDFVKSAKFYQDAVRLGFNNPEPLLKLLKISCYLQEKSDIIKFVKNRFKGLKKGRKRWKIPRSYGKIRIW
jgi:tetratricopeptide (TPR) repeat protein